MLEPGVAIFAVTRGQWSMIDAIQACLAQLRPGVTLTLWTWVIAEYETEVFTALADDGRIGSAVLLCDAAARNKAAPVLRAWVARHGSESLKFVVSHAKIATLEGDLAATGQRVRLLLRGSMNLNFNPRFEQFDLTEGGPDFDLVRQVEASIPRVELDASWLEVQEASKVGDTFGAAGLQPFRGLRPWKP